MVKVNLRVQAQVFGECLLHDTTTTQSAERSADSLGLYGQVKKRIRWMPWQSEAMKDVIACDKLRGGGK